MTRTNESSKSTDFGVYGNADLTEELKTNCPAAKF